MRTQDLALERRSPRPLLYLAAFAALALSLMAIVGPALATHVAPILHQGNPSCGALGEYDHEFRINAPETGFEEGTYDDPNSNFVVEITLHDTADGQTFDFDANLAVDAVFAKGGPGGNLYVYDPAVTADTGLHAPGNDQGTAVATPPWSGLSHISFCFNDVPEETPTPSPTPTPVVTPTPTPVVTPTPTPEQSVHGGTPTPTPEQSVAGGTGTPAPSQPDTAMSPNGAPSPVPTLVFGLILLASLGTLAYANVKTARSRG